MPHTPREMTHPPAAPAPIDRHKAEPVAGGLPPRLAFIERAHQRSQALGLSRAEKSLLDPLVRSDLNLARERNHRLYLHAAPVMQMLFEQIVNTESMIVLTDAQGTILHAVGDDGFLARADKVALAPGQNWAEHAKGTNAIGTALFEEAPTLVHAGEHFMLSNSFLTCSAAPIFDPRGNMLGVLDVSGDHRAYHQHTMGLVRMSARMIENHWLSDDCNNRLRLHFHPRAEFIGTLLEGVLVVEADGRIVGANRGALDLLGVSDAGLRAQVLPDLLGVSPAAVYDHFRAPMSAPMQLSTPSGQAVFVQARFDWPSRPLVAGLGLQRAADAQVDALIHKVGRVLDRDIPLLLLGETGTGKELLARAVHHDSARAHQPFVAVNCAAIPESLIEAELFGYEDGAFTGARRKGSPGRLLQAHNGTLFLDEIGDMPLSLQARLLRVLQERSVTPLGSSRSIPVDIALIGATHRNLREMIAHQAFREDLYYRLNGLAVRLPPLRERSDLAVLAGRILRLENPQQPPALSPQVLALFQRHHWPGNIRQLANVLRTAAVMAGPAREITREHLPDDFLEELAGAQPGPAGGQGGPSATALLPAMPTPAWPGSAGHSANPPAAAAAASPRTLEEAEGAMIRAAVAAADGNISAAAKALGVSRNTVYRRLRGDAAR